MATFGSISSRLMKRVVVDALLVLGVFLLPWWFVLPLACVLVFMFEDFFEFPLVAFLIDLLYGSPLPYFFNSSFILSIGALALYAVLTAVKKQMRF